jgi:putative addiction module component (TIGR02574 family)
MKLADLPGILALSAREKLELIDELWQDVTREVDRLEVSPEEKQLLDERWASFLGNPGAALTIEELQERLGRRASRETASL